MHFQNVTLGTRQIAYAEANPASTKSIVFIHGNSMNKEIFSGQLGSPEFTNWRLLVPELPGHGSSSWLAPSESDQYSLNFYANAIRDFVHALGLERPLVVGHSLGGHLAIRLSQILDLAGLMIFQAPPLESIEDLAQGFFPHPAGQFLFSETISPEQADIIVAAGFAPPSIPPSFIKASILATDPKCRSSVVRALMEQKFYGEVSAVRNLRYPVAIVHGRQDVLVNAEYIEGLKFTNLWGGGLRYLNGGHYVHIDHRSEFNELLRRYANEIFSG